MFNTVKNLQQGNDEHMQSDRRNHNERRLSQEPIRFPFIDNSCRLVMKDRRISERRTSGSKVVHKPLQLVNKFFKK